MSTLPSSARAEAAAEFSGPPGLRLHLVPSPQPPLDDAGRPAQLVLPGIAPPRPLPRPGPRPRPTGHRSPDTDFGPVWSRRNELPDPREAGRRLLTVAVEALAGRRPLDQLRPLASAGVFTALSRGRRPSWCTGSSAPIRLGRVHVCEPVDGVAEVTAVVTRDGRAHALAARLEGLDGRWRCTALQVG